ncbi:mono-functional DNA-alkylating methyl methanesulfonate N-term-domain-containing protein [Choanephora cucurbitarum]|nr:mono-functional DNA-alkylating methyl methanesulfonate N-term-domain-containing protein [Choanephora cucurbitarum]
MFAYYRTSSYSTVINQVLRGSITSADPSDLVLGNSFAWFRIGSVTENNPILLEEQLEQTTFGIISDARLLPCNFQSSEKDHVVLDLGRLSVPYAKHTRHHSIIEGEDVIIALSEYGKLVFLTVISDMDQQVNRFETLAEIYLESPGIEYTKLSKKLAVDPHGRAIAVASFQDRFDIFIMNKSLSRVHFDPVVGRGSEYEQGIIWHMEFLYTKEDSMDRILLVLVVYNDVEKLCRLNLYAIDASDVENVTIEKASRLPLEKEQQVCLLTADDLACGNVLYPTSIIPRPFGSTECSLFTTFASHLDASKSFVYLGAAEGCLFKLHVHSSTELIWETIQSVPSVGQSMCMLGTIDIIDQHANNDNDMQADLVLVAGESTDHLVLAIPCNASGQMIQHTTIQSFVNRAPLTDFQVAYGYRHQQDALIACSGQGDHGALSIITFGIETTALSTSDKPEWRGISQCWNIMSETNHASLLIASSLLDTRILIAKEGHISDVTTKIKIRHDVETLHVASLDTQQCHFLLQVHYQGISITCLDNLDIEPLAWKPETEADSNIIFATSCKQDNSILVALCITYEDVFQIQMIDISYKDKDIQSWDNLVFQERSKRIIQSCPSYFGFLELQSCFILTIGAFDSSLVFYSTELHLIQEIDLACSSAKECSIPNSVAILKSAHSTKPIYLIVGLRQGDLLSFKVNDGLLMEEVLVQKKQPYLHAIGSQTVKLFSCSRNGIYALSEQLWRLTCSDKDRIELEQVLLPRFQRSIDTIVCFDADMPLLRQTGNPLAVFADDKLHMFQLNLESKINTNKIQLGQTPRKVLYDKALSYLVVTTTTIEAGKRKNYMQLLDPSSGESLSNLEPLGLDLDYGQNSMVLSMAEEETRFSKLAKQLKPKKETGSLILFRLKAKRGNSSSFSIKKVWTLEKLSGGVHSVCPHSAGLDTVTGKLIEIAHKHLLSTITSIHGDGERICVTSHNNESIAFFGLDDERGKLVFIKSDSEFRSIHHSLVIDQQLAIGVSQSGGMVALYDSTESPYEERLDCLFSFHYSDTLVSPSLALLGTQSDAFYDQTKLFTSHVLPWSLNIGTSNSQQTSDTIKPIVTGTIAGGIVHVYRISSQLHLLLDALQDLLLAFEPTKPLLGSPDDFVNYYCQLSGGEKATIHGDLVEMFLRLSFDEQLRLVSIADDQISQPLDNALRLFINMDAEDKQAFTVDHAVELIKDILIGFLSCK